MMASILSTFKHKLEKSASLRILLEEVMLILSYSWRLSEGSQLLGEKKKKNSVGNRGYQTFGAITGYKYKCNQPFFFHLLHV